MTNLVIIIIGKYLKKSMELIVLAYTIIVHD